MKRAIKRDSLHSEKFYFKKNLQKCKEIKLFNTFILLPCVLSEHIKLNSLVI